MVGSFRIRWIAGFASVCLVAVLARGADQWAGKYKDETLKIEVTADGPDAYSGVITLADNQFPLKAKAQDGKLQGAFTSDGNEFPFTATMEDGRMKLVTERATYRLSRTKAAVNPLVAAQAKEQQTAVPVPPPTPGVQKDGAAPAPKPAAADVPKGYAVMNVTMNGRAMITEKANAKSAREALDSACDDLDDFFDDDWDVTAGYEDQRDHRSVLAGITAKYKGQPVRGLVFSRMKEKGGATAVVLIYNAKMTRGEYMILTSAPLKPANAGNAPNPAPPGPPQPREPTAEELAAAAARVTLQPYRFPDGTGEIGLAAGWQTNAQSCQTGFEVKGPAGQTIALGQALSVNTPNSTAVAMARQYPVPGMMMFVADFSDPADALTTLAPQISQWRQRNNLGAREVDNVTKLQDLKPMSEGSRWAILRYGVTVHEPHGQAKHHTAFAQVGCTPITNESWMLWITVALLPDESMQEDLPTAIAIINSWKTNDRVVQQKTDAWIADRNAWFSAQQQSHRDVQAQYDRNNQSWRDNQVTQSRSADDFSETMRGYRTVEDTTTGEKSSVDLGNVDQIVDQLNETDPGRYKQIPLRDENDPMPEPGR